MKSHLILMAALIAAVLSACGSPSISEGPVAHTLNGNSRLPTALIREHFEPGSWRLLGDTRYDAYLILRGRVEPNTSLSGVRVVETHPGSNQSREERAQGFAQQVRLSGMPVGTQLRPSAEVYVIFYEPPGEGSMALVFARFTGTVFTGGSTSRDEGNTWIQMFRY